MASQNSMILAHLFSIGDDGKRRSISGMEALGLYRCVSLTRRISDLKDMGYRIISTTKKDQTGKRYVRYRLASK